MTLKSGLYSGGAASTQCSHLSTVPLSMSSGYGTMFQLSFSRPFACSSNILLSCVSGVCRKAEKTHSTHQNEFYVNVCADAKCPHLVSAFQGQCISFLCEGIYIHLGYWVQVFAQVSVKAGGVKMEVQTVQFHAKALVSYIHKFTLLGRVGLCKCEGLIHNVAKTLFSYLFKDVQHLSHSCEQTLC